MTRKKLTLDDLKVQSFSTDLNVNEKANLVGAGASDAGSSITHCWCLSEDLPCSNTEQLFHSCDPNFCETERGCEPYTSERYPTCDNSATCTPGQNGC